MSLGERGRQRRARRGDRPRPRRYAGGAPAAGRDERRGAQRGDARDRRRLHALPVDRAVLRVRGARVPRVRPVLVKE